MSQLPVSTHDLFPHIHSPSRLLGWKRVRWVGLVALVFFLLQLWTEVSPYERSSSAKTLQDDVDADGEGSLAAASLAVLHQDARQLQREKIFSARWHQARQEQQQQHSNHATPVTAVLVFSNQARSLRTQVGLLSSVPWIQEILVWNDGARSLNVSDFGINEAFASSVRVFNAPAPMFDLGYFYGCSLAKHATCLIQDLATYNPSLDALYLKHTDSSSLITAAVTPTELWTLKHLQFTNAEFHTGVSWLRSALLPKTAASRFLNQISVSPVELPSRSMLRHATLWFGLWTNTFPDLLRTDLEWLDVEGSRAVELWDRPQSPSIVILPLDKQHKATTLMFDIIALQDPSYIPFPFSIAPGPSPHDARGVISVNTSDSARVGAEAQDTALFLSSQSPFPSPKSLLAWPRKTQVEAPQKRPLLIQTAQDVSAYAFDPHIDLAQGVQSFIKKVDELKVGRDQLFPSLTEWRQSLDWTLAVDGRSDTCWVTRHPPRVSDHFGLHWMHPRTVKGVQILGSRDLLNLLGAEDEDSKGNSWALQLLSTETEEQQQWSPVRFRQEQEEHSDSGLSMDVVKVTAILNKPFEASKLRLISTDAKSAALVLCELNVL